MLKKITKGQYKGQYEGPHGVIYNEELAKKRFPAEFESKPAKKKAASKRTK